MSSSIRFIDLGWIQSDAEAKTVDSDATMTPPDNVATGSGSPVQLQVKSGATDLGDVLPSLAKHSATAISVMKAPRKPAGRRRRLGARNINEIHLSKRCGQATCLTYASFNYPEAKGFARGGRYSLEGMVNKCVAKKDKKQE